VLLVALCFSTLVIAAPINIELKVVTKDGLTELKVNKNDSPCDNAPSDSACIKVAHGRSPFIIFTLPEACEGKDHPIYKLTGMKITQFEKIWPTRGDPLNSRVAKDFKADPETGEIKFGVIGNDKSSSKLKFKNLNKNAYTVFYEISASPCDDDSDYDDISLDPEIRNKGNN
jgi:hypothetical protein